MTLAHAHAGAYTGPVLYRNPRDLAKSLGGMKARAMRALISARQILTGTYRKDERVTVLGRSSIDTGAGEDSEEVEVEGCQPIGLVARPEERATVAAVIANVGADGANPYMIGTIDSTRQLVLDARQVGAALNITILYNSTDVIELRDGKIRAGSLGGTTKPLAFLDDANSLNNRITELESAVNTLISIFNAHTHVISGSPPVTSPTTPSAPSANTSANVVGTQRLEGE